MLHWHKLSFIEDSTIFPTTRNVILLYFIYMISLSLSLYILKVLGSLSIWFYWNNLPPCALGLIGHTLHVCCIEWKYTDSPVKKIFWVQQSVRKTWKEPKNYWFTWKRCNGTYCSQLLWQNSLNWMTCMCVCMYIYIYIYKDCCWSNERKISILKG